MLVLIGSVVDILQRGPVPRWQAEVLLAVSVPVIVVFVCLDALIEADFDRRRALAQVPRVFVRDALLLGLVFLYAWASDASSGAVSGGGTSAGGSAPPRSNRASNLVDTEAFAAVLRAQSVRAVATGFDTSYASHALAYGADNPGRRRPRVSITVYQPPLAHSMWNRVARTLPPAGQGRLGDAACASGSRLVFRRGDSVVDLRLHEFQGDTAQKLFELGEAIDKRLSGTAADLMSP